MKTLRNIFGLFFVLFFGHSSVSFGDEGRLPVSSNHKADLSKQAASELTLKQQLVDLIFEAKLIEEEATRNSLDQKFKGALSEIGDLIDLCSDKLFQLERTKGPYRSFVSSDLNFCMTELESELLGLKRSVVSGYSVIEY